MEPAYAKLKGPKFEGYVRSLKATLGRSTSKDSIHLGKDKVISKQHAEIEWDPYLKKFTIKCIGKNPIRVARKKLDKDDLAFPLENKTPVRIGNCCFYFLLPKEDTLA